MLKMAAKLVTSLVNLAVLLVDVSAQSCIITPLNPTTLNATGGALVSGTTNVTIRCVCIGSFSGNVRWYDINTNFLVQSNHPTEYVAGSPYSILNNNRDVTLVIPTFNDSYDGTYNCGIFYSNTEFASPSAAVTLTIACPSLNGPSNGMITCSLGGDGVPDPGDTCTYTCDTGYEVTNSNTRTCQSDGTWSGSDTMCSRVLCPSLDAPNNGMISCLLGDDGVPFYQDTCTFTCNNGYEITGSSMRTCQSDRTWTGSDPVCTRVLCLALSAPDNGEISCALGDDGVPSYEDTCTFTCNDGYELTGSENRRCRSSKTWSGSDTMCRRLVTVRIVSNPDGTSVSGSTNTFDYPILSSVTLICIVIADDNLPVTVDSYRWNTAGCYTHPNRNNGNPTCFPDGQTTQSVTDNDVTAEDAGTITCTVTINGSDYTSGPFTLRISGIALIKVMVSDGTVDNAVVSANAIPDYSYVNDRSDNNVQLARCVTGLGPSGTDPNSAIGVVYFNGNRIPDVGCSDSSSPIVRLQSAYINNAVGVINIVQCRTFSTAVEGIYTCIMMNSSMMSESIRFGVYFTGRTAPVINFPLSSTVTLPAGSSLNLNCTSQGSPPDTFTWRKDGGSLLQSITNQVTYNSTSAISRADYSIDSVTTNDSGTYTCTVTNPIGSDSAMITVVVTSVEPPTNVRTIVLTPRSVEVTWDPSPSPGITSYFISYTTTASYTNGGSMSVDGSTTSHTLTNLEEGTLYTITVHATNSSGTSPNSNEVSVTTYTDVPSSSPLNVMVTSVNPASLKVSWQPPLEINWNGPIDHMIQYTRVGSSDMMSENVNSGTTHTMSGLVAYVNYSVIVAAVNVNGTGPFSNPMMQISGEDVPSEPQLEMFSVNSSSVTLQWSPPDPPNGVITQYSIQLNGTDWVNLNNSVRMYTIGQLPSDTVYVLQLTASTSVEEGPPSSVTILTSPGPVSNVVIHNESVTSSALTLTWMETSLTNSKLSHYTVFYLPVRGPYDSIMANNRRKRQSAQAGELTMNFTGTTGTLTNLYGAVTYRIQVAAVSTFNGQNVIGDRSATIEMLTLVGVPTAPQNLNYTNLIDTGVMFNVTLTWSRPDPPNGIITQYNISYVDTNSRGSNSYIQEADIDSSIESSYTWTNLLQGNYRFSVVAFTSKGQGEAASLILVIIRTHSKAGNDSSSSDSGSDDNSSDDNAGVNIALAILFAIAVIGLVISIVIIVILVIQHKQSRYDVNESNIRYSEVKQSVSRGNTITDSKYVQSTEPEYEAIVDPKPNMKPADDVKMDANPAYQATS